MSEAILIISGISAVRFWLDYTSRINPSVYSYEKCKRVALPENCRAISSPPLIRMIAFGLGLSLPLNVMVPSGAPRHSSKVIKYSSASRHMPADSFVKLDPLDLPFEFSKAGADIYVASPEYCFLAFANKLPLALLVELGCNLCAGYAYSQESELEQVFREPVTKAEMIADYVAASRRNAGYRKASRAVRFICDGSNSPMETKLAVMSVLPLFEGGYGLPHPVLNKDIILSREAAAALGRDSCSCDMVWEASRVVMEYDSNLTHLGTSQHGYDKSKANALGDSGYKLITITAENTKTIGALDLSFDSLRRRLKVKSRRAEMNRYYHVRRNIHRILIRINRKPFLLI
ncbi:MAG: hypothetical protein IJM53_03245 [Lachnospiraceae bacterium]|nr:hypothetical protein [Lachnospiraceae bacterium]